MTVDQHLDVPGDGLAAYTDGVGSAETFVDDERSPPGAGPGSVVRRAVEFAQPLEERQPLG